MHNTLKVDRDFKNNFLRVECTRWTWPRYVTSQVIEAGETTKQAPFQKRHRYRRGPDTKEAKLQKRPR